MKKLTDRNPHTGEKLQSKANSDKYRESHDRIFGKEKCAQCGEQRKHWQDCDAPNCVNQNDHTTN